MHSALESKALIDQANATICDYEKYNTVQKQVHQRIKNYNLSSTKANTKSFVISSPASLPPDY